MYSKKVSKFNSDTFILATFQELMVEEIAKYFATDSNLFFKSKNFSSLCQ